MNDDYSAIRDVFQSPNVTNVTLLWEDFTPTIQKIGLSPEIAQLGKIAYGTVAPLIISFGIITNILNLVILSRPSLRGPTYRYLMWLAVSNLLVCIVLLPFILHSHEVPVKYHYAFYLAHVEMPVGNFLIASSVFIVVGLSIDRYVAICHPRKYRNLHSPRVASVRISISFCIAFLIYIPMCIGKTVVPADSGGFLPKDNLQVTGTKWWLAYKFLLEICARFAPAIILALLNIWIIKEFKKISQRRRFLSHNSCGNSGFPSQSIPEISDGFMSMPPEEKTPSSHTKEEIRAEAAAWKETSFYRVSEKEEHSGNGLLQTISDPNGCLYINTTPTPSDQCIELQMSPGHSEKTSGGSVTSSVQHVVEVPTSNGFLKSSDTLHQTYPCGDKDGPLLVISKIESKSGSTRRSYPRRAMSERRLDMERRLILLLVSIIVAFFVTNIPSAFLSLTFSDEKRDSVQYQIFRAVANNLEFLNFGLHFVLYFLFSKDIRKVFITIVKRSCHKVWKTLASSTGSKIPKY